MNRGIRGDEIFSSNNDRKKFLEYLGKSVERFSIIVHTYCLMTNHFHLVIETPEPNLSAAIQWLTVSYAVYFNRKHKRPGHVFQGRFKAILVDADEYLKPLSRYIHLNPVRAKLTTTPAAYQWSSYPAYLDKTKAPLWLETEWLLSTFGRKRREALRSYREFVEGVDVAQLENPHKHIVGGFILGDSSFVNWVKETFLSEKADVKEIPQLKALKPKASLDQIVQLVCETTGSSREQILEKGRKRDLARELAIHLARDHSGISVKQLGEFFGGISGAGITMRYKQFSQRLAEDQKLRRLVQDIRSKILNF
jgi:REP element-mobilizing transposase RayT